MAVSAARKIADERAAVVAEALTWLGTPYHHHARLKGVGTDCGMILCEVYHAVGIIPYVDPLPYAADWHLHHEDEKYLGWLTKFAKPTKKPKPGDVGLWKFGRCFSHGGIMIDETRVVHAYLRQGVIVTAVNEHPLASATGPADSRPVKFFTFWGK